MAGDTKRNENMRIFGFTLLSLIVFLIVAVSMMDDSADREMGNRIDNVGMSRGRHEIVAGRPTSARNHQNESDVSAPLDETSKTPQSADSIRVTIGHVKGKLPAPPLFFRAVSGRSVGVHATPVSPHDPQAHMGVYQLSGITAGDSLTILVADVAKLIEIDHRRNYSVLFHDKIPIVFEVIGDLAVLCELQGDLELRYSTRNNNGNRLTLGQGAQAEARLEPGEYEISLAFVSSTQPASYLKVIGTSIELDIRNGASLIVKPEDGRLVHQVVLERIELCELTVTGVVKGGVGVIGPMVLSGSKSAKKGIWSSHISPVAKFWLKTGEYKLFDLEKQMMGYQRLTIHPGDLRLSVSFKPSKIRGVLVLLKDGHRVASDVEGLQHGDIIRGINDRRI